MKSMAENNCVFCIFQCTENDVAAIPGIADVLPGTGVLAAKKDDKKQRGGVIWQRKAGGTKMKIQPGTQAYEVLRLLCLTREYPRQSIPLLTDGSPVWVRRVIKQLTDEGYIRLLKQERDIRSLGLRKKGWQAVYGDAAYSRQTLNPGSIRRYHRLAEAAAMMRLAGVRIYPEEKPDWDTFLNDPWTAEGAVYWTSREMKTHLELQRNFNSSRFVGLLFRQRPYISYNLGKGQICWNDGIEAHTRALVSRMVRAPTENAILFGQSMANALAVLETVPGNTRGYMSPVTGYRNLYFVPLQPAARWQLQRLTTPNWRQLLVNSLLNAGEQNARLHNIECDGMIVWQGGRLPALVACDCNLPQLYRLKAALTLRHVGTAAVFCLPYQAEMYKAYFGAQAVVIPVVPEDGGINR